MQQLNIATHHRSPREERERNTTLRLRALLAEFHRPLYETPLLDPEFDAEDET